MDDTRFKLDNVNPTIVRLVSADDESRWGTGIVVEPNKILTAAHVLRGLGDIKIYQGEHEDATRKEFTINSAKIHPDYKPFEVNKHLHDLAVITTNENFEDVMVFSHAEYSLMLHPINWIGYPADLIEQNNNIISQWGTNHRVFNDTDDASNLILTERVTSYQGQSGSGVINNAGPNGPRVIGVLSGSGKSAFDTEFTLLRGSNFDFVYDAVYN
ncbi:trypsin-like serine peptidase [Bacillus cereus]|uniref:trypsin-like serine peptidase n=1 Tax=Bacillus cereus TaxID=1396 RepID=UPI001596413C|nr:trypsin-like serine protease [Bacillus cereus]